MSQVIMCLQSLSITDYLQVPAVGLVVIAMWIIGRKHTNNKIGYALGFAAQPFWLAIMMTKGLPLILLLGVYHTFAWGRLWYNYEFKSVTYIKWMIYYQFNYNEVIKYNYGISL